MSYRSSARCSLLRPTPFYGSSPWSHHPCVIDVSANIDTDGAALPPARCDISTLVDISIFVCPSIALSSSANRSPMEAPPFLARGDFAIFIALESGCGEYFAFTLQPGQQAAGVAHACPVLFQPHPQSNSWPRAPSLVTWETNVFFL
ncbi:uncharacterized protein [Drosophila suzukii]|uniref:Uncharacterized protein n=1 Tax=Drosophila suzukii TaxID=28584 RepID=A0ABM4TQY6_DROSZ